jgi:hypothetical protein
VRRDQLEHAIRAATEIIQQDAIIIIGSQAILGSYTEDELPPEATLSDEVDACPLRDDEAETLATTLDAVIGEMSQFHETHGFYIQGVGRHTAVLPEGWVDRLIRVENDNTRGRTGLCLEPHDLCAAKLIANRPKDHRFVRALLEAEKVKAETLRERLAQVKGHEAAVELATEWLDGAAGTAANSGVPPARPQPRHPKGQPGGGRFADRPRGEPNITLD